GHLRDLVPIHREQGRARAHAGRGQRGLAAGMAAADYDHVETVVVRPDDHFPMQNSLKMRSRMSSVVVSPMISPIALMATRRSAAMHSAATCCWIDTRAWSTEVLARSRAERSRRWVISTPSLGSNPCV